MTPQQQRTTNEITFEVLKNRLGYISTEAYDGLFSAIKSALDGERSKIAALEERVRELESLVLAKEPILTVDGSAIDILELKKENESLKRDLQSVTNATQGIVTENAILKAKVEEVEAELKETLETAGNRLKKISQTSAQLEKAKVFIRYISVASSDTGQKAIQRYAKEALAQLDGVED